MWRCFGSAWLLAVVAMALGACATAPRAAPDAQFFRALVAERYVAPFRTGDIEAWSGAFAEHAVALHNRRPPDEGRAAIIAFGNAVREHFRLERFEVTVREVRGSGDWVLTRGDYLSRFVSRADGSAPFGEEQGKFVLLWERQADGEWKIVLDMGNGNR
jgi:ketosteroid isomerase-like protein